jgi:DNA-binding transcriptional ArsR family regulator
MARSKGKDSMGGAASATAALIKAVADPDRLKIIHSLRDGPKSVSQLAKVLRARIVNVSHHLSVLRKCRIVKFEKMGRFVHYTLNPDLYRSERGSDCLNLGRCRLEIGK